MAEQSKISLSVLDTAREARVLREARFTEHGDHDIKSCSIAMICALCHAFAAAAVRGEMFPVENWCRENGINDENMIRTADMQVLGVAKFCDLVTAHLAGVTTEEVQ